MSRKCVRRVYSCRRKWTVDELTVDDLAVDELTIDELTCYPFIILTMTGQWWEEGLQLTNICTRVTKLNIRWFNKFNETMVGCKYQYLMTLVDMCKHAAALGNLYFLSSENRHWAGSGSHTVCGIKSWTSSEFKSMISIIIIHEVSFLLCSDCWPNKAY